MSSLSPQQFPDYQRGWNEVATPTRVVRNYDDSDKVHPSHFGLPHIDFGDIPGEYHPSLGNPPEVRVPVASLVAMQPYVHAPHVQNLSTVPGHVLDKANEPVYVDRLKDGRHAIDEGTHRSAAAIVRGDTHITARLQGEWK